jgi:hypothetical protein
MYVEEHVYWPIDAHILLKTLRYPDFYKTRPVIGRFSCTVFFSEVSDYLPGLVFILKPPLMAFHQTRQVTRAQ